MNPAERDNNLGHATDSPYLSDPDVRLMLSFQAGDKTSFEKLMMKYYSRILNFIYKFIKNRAQVEDLTQFVFYPGLSC